nr:metallophosphoesterase [Streptomyces sp. ADI98-10]
MTPSVAHLSDPHLTTRPGAAAPAAGLRAALRRVLALDPLPDCAVITGDLTERGRPDEYAALREVVGAFPLPLHLVAGNHDVPEALVGVFGETRFLGGGMLTSYVVAGAPGSHGGGPGLAGRRCARRAARSRSVVPAGPGPRPEPRCTGPRLPAPSSGACRHSVPGLDGSGGRARARRGGRRASPGRPGAGGPCAPPGHGVVRGQHGGRRAEHVPAERAGAAGGRARLSRRARLVSAAPDAGGPPGTAWVTHTVPVGGG